MANKCCGSNDSSIEINTETCEEVTACCSQAQLSCDPNCTKALTTNLKGAVTILESWSIPICGGVVTVTIPYLEAVSIGSFLWNPTYGYFQIIAFDITTKKATLLNICKNNGIIGSVISKNTLFIVVSIQNEGSVINIFLSANFIAPAVSSCTTITVSATGIILGDTITFGGASYKVTEVSSDGTTLTICNEGQGFTAGLIIFSKDFFGNFLYSISINPGISITKYVAENVVGGNISTTFIPM